MNYSRFVLAASLLVPSFVSAQITAVPKRGAGKEADWNAVAGKSAPTGPTISAKDFEKASPFRLLVDKKKDLKLTDAQIVAAKEADVKLLAANAERFTLLDSLKKDAKPRTSGSPAPEDEVRMVIARESLNGVVRDIRVSFDAAAKEGLPGLDESQQKTAQELMQKYSEEMQDMLREKLGARGGGGGAPPSGRSGRPPVQAEVLLYPHS